LSWEVKSLEESCSGHCFSGSQQGGMGRQPAGHLKGDDAACHQRQLKGNNHRLQVLRDTIAVSNQWAWWARVWWWWRGGERLVCTCT
jgi:hypothetical protein